MLPTRLDVRSEADGGGVSTKKMDGPYATTLACKVSDASSKFLDLVKREDWTKSKRIPFNEEGSMAL
jgi:hypothetical protein